MSKGGEERTRGPGLHDRMPCSSRLWDVGPVLNFSVKWAGHGPCLDDYGEGEHELAHEACLEAWGTDQGCSKSCVIEPGCFSSVCASHHCAQEARATASHSSHGIWEKPSGLSSIR